MTALSTPAQIMATLEAIDRDLAERLPSLEKAAEDHFRAKREKEKTHAEQFLLSQGSVAERNARADAATATMGAEAEASYEARKAAVRVLEARATIGASLLKVQR